MPKRSMHVRKYSSSTGCGEWYCGQSGVCASRVAVEVVLDVDAATRVVVLEPRAPDVVVLLEHHDLDAGLAEPVRGDDARHAGADNAHGHARTRTDLADRPGRPPQVGAVEGELGLVERLGVIVDRRATHELDEPAAIGGSQRRLLRAARVAVADQRAGGELARLGDLLRRVAGIGLEHSREVRTQVVADDREIAGQVGNRREQRRDRGRPRGSRGSRHPTRRSARARHRSARSQSGARRVRRCRPLRDAREGVRRRVTREARPPRTEPRA